MSLLSGWQVSDDPEYPSASELAKLLPATERRRRSIIKDPVVIAALVGGILSGGGGLAGIKAQIDSHRPDCVAPDAKLEQVVKADPQILPILRKQRDGDEAACGTIYSVAVSVYDHLQNGTP